jgi:hypothetical protein
MNTSQPFTSQELAYLARVARWFARRGREDADRNDNPGVRAIFESSERTYLKRAAK